MITYLIALLHNLIYFVLILPFYFFKWIVSLFDSEPEKLKRGRKKMAN